MPRKYVCPKCHTQVKEKCNDDGIECEVCRKWYHFSCSDLSDQQFNILCTEKSLEWICTRCQDDECPKCERIFRHEKRLTCSSCKFDYHPRCQGLNIKSCEKIDLKNGSAILVIILLFPSIPLLLINLKFYLLILSALISTTIN